jgi:hypothetical protein
MTQPTTQTPDILLNVIVILLAPMFRGATGGDITLARIAAVETVNAYRASNDVHLIAIAQVIAYGLAALGSLSLSMADDISVSMTLRLRGNANALNRSAEQNHRRTLTHVPAPSNQPAGRTQPADLMYEAAVLATVAETQKRVDAAQSALQPAPTPTPPVTLPPATEIPDQDERQHQANWAAAITKVAGEFTTSLHNLPPIERKMASLRASALSTSANNLLSGVSPPRLRPGDLAGLFRSSAA